MHTATSCTDHLWLMSCQYCNLLLESLGILWCVVSRVYPWTYSMRTTSSNHWWKMFAKHHGRKCIAHYHRCHVRPQNEISPASVIIENKKMVISLNFEIISVCYRNVWLTNLTTFAGTCSKRSIRWKSSIVWHIWNVRLYTAGDCCKLLCICRDRKAGDLSVGS